MLFTVTLQKLFSKHSVKGHVSSHSGLWSALEMPLANDHGASLVRSSLAEFSECVRITRELVIIQIPRPHS